MRAIKKIKYVLGLCNRKGCLSKAIVDIKIDGEYTHYKGCLCEKHYDEFLKEEIKKTTHEGSVQEQQKIKIKVDGALLSKSLANYLTNCYKASDEVRVQEKEKFVPSTSEGICIGEACERPR